MTEGRTRDYSTYQESNVTCKDKRKDGRMRPPVRM